jgi:hypothetical protein
MEPMPRACDQAKRYRDRAQECLQIVATSQTPGTGEIYLLIAKHYLLLAASEKRTASSPSAPLLQTEIPTCSDRDR